MRISNNELFLQYSDIKKGGTEVSFSFFCRPFIPQFGIKKITGGGRPPLDTPLMYTRFHI